MAAYLDNSATTRIREEALNKYNEISRECYGNPSSLHTLGYNAEKELRLARQTILDTLQDKTSTVVFTASGSEANNLAIIGRAFSKERYIKRNAKIVTSLGEHASVSEPLKLLESLGFRICNIPTGGGAINMERLSHELDDSVILVSMMMVNNETGALYDTAAVKELMKRSCPEALLHVDATQGYMKVPFTKRSCGADMITLSSHKIEGPKGVGALVIDPRVIKERGIRPLIFGGGQEGGLRSGTENVPAICAFAEAARLAKAEFDEAFAYISEIREYLLQRLRSELPEISPTLPAKYAPHILNITLPGIKSETMLHYLSSVGVYVSSGSACSSNSQGVSSALTAYGRSADEADSSVRVSLSKRNTREDVDALIDGISSGLKRLQRK